MSFKPSWKLLSLQPALFIIAIGFLITQQKPQPVRAHGSESHQPGLSNSFSFSTPSNSQDSSLSHRDIDTVQFAPGEEQAMYDRMKQKGIGILSDDSWELAQTPLAGTEHIVGKWEGPYDWPVIAIHATLMPNGRVLAYDSVGDNPTESYTNHTFTRATVWNPSTNSHSRADVNTGYNIFCSSLTVLLDGRVFAAGGNKNSNLDGIDKTHFFNPSSQTWSRGPNMLQGDRWYPSVTALSNGDSLISGGGPTIPEIFQRNGSFRSLPGANAQIASDRTYHWLKQAPNGQIAYLGPDPTLYYLNTNGNGNWFNFRTRDQINRSYGSHAMYAPGRALVSGGGNFNSSAVTIDLNNGTVNNTRSMTYQRLQHNLTVLPNGRVLATGGMQNTSQGLVDVNKGVFAAEWWNPNNGRWTTLASMRVTRQYHSIALLLPDGRVLSAGGGICGACQQQGYIAKNAEIFSPPDLFRNDGTGRLAPRPSINSASSSLTYGQTFNISTPQASDISRVTLVRFGGVTHSVNMDQQFVSLSFNRGSGTLQVTAPNNNRTVPPGNYMLFILNSDGVPSVAKILTLS
ncbi:MAG: galactose oxidase-like domain-containing protein [Synechococcales bacterium]|nr:galactose oxidase-like domain-containing protein [Synechococcales bacterium]